MPSDSGERRPARGQAQQMAAPPPGQEHLRCPRCDSTDTKFCYYNNYNMSQPRHFCKSCRRYWTQGGTLRNIPVGGGSRKNAKRTRTTSSSSSSSSQDPIPAMPMSVHFAAEPDLSVPIHGDLNIDSNVTGNFTSLLNSQGPGFLPPPGGYGLGLGSGFEEMGFGLGRGGWPFTEVGESGGGGNTWQLGSGEAGFSDGDCFSWPDLAISTPGKGLK